MKSFRITPWTHLSTSRSIGGNTSRMQHRKRIQSFTPTSTCGICSYLPYTMTRQKSWSSSSMVLNTKINRFHWQFLGHQRIIRNTILWIRSMQRTQIRGRGRTEHTTSWRFSWQSRIKTLRFSLWYLISFSNALHAQIFARLMKYFLDIMTLKVAPTGKKGWSGSWRQLWRNRSLCT